MSDDITLRQLRCFAAVAEYRHFTRAADAMGLPQPQVSREIARLERDLGFRLFERTTREVRLTPAGVEFAAHIPGLFQQLTDARMRAQAVSDGVQGHLAVAFAGSITYSWLPRLTQAFRAKYPRVELVIHSEMLTGAQVDALLGHRIDAGLLRPPVADPRVATRKVDSERLVVAVPDRHPLARAGAPIDIGRLADEGFIGYRGTASTTNRAVREICRDAGFAPTIIHHVPDTHSLVALIAAGMGIALVPHSTCHFTVRGVRYLSLSDNKVRLPLILAWRRSDTSATLRNFLELVREMRGSGRIPASVDVDP